MNLLEFSIWSDYGHFRKPYTTTSPLTYPFPPRTVMAGIIGAIIGKPKNDITCQNDDSFIGIGISPDNPVKKIRVAQNLTQVAKNLKIMDLKENKNKVNQIRYEFLKHPKFNVYFYHKDPSIYNSVKDHLKNHTSVYTPYLGISELIANFKLEKELSFKEMGPNGTVEIKSVVSKKYIEEDSVQFKDSSEYFNIRMPNKMDEERIVREYSEIIFERNGESIFVKPNKYWQLEDGRNIIFL